MTDTDSPPRAGAFIVTIYGDVVAPRDAALWMGTLIEICAERGLSESVVRTAVSRLVAAGTLVGTRKGRRSYYRLTEQAKSEFAAASKRIYDGPPKAAGWLLAFTDDDPPPNWARLGAHALIAPNLPDISQPDGAILSAMPAAGDPASFSLWAQGQWRSDVVAAAYRAVLETPVRAHSADEALGCRILLVHRYRHAVLLDPCLPGEVLPADWPASRARRFFVRQYLTLTPLAEEAFSAYLAGEIEPFQCKTEAISARISRMSHEIKEN